MLDKARLQHAFKNSLVLPVAIMLFILTAYGIGYIFGVSDADIMNNVQYYFDTYGLPFILISSFLEAAFFVGFYYPGSAIIFMGVILARGDVAHTILVVLMVMLGLFSGYVLNYAIGKYGFYKAFYKLGMGRGIEQAQASLSKSGMRSIFFTYWAPAFASFTATAAGILQLPFKKFLLYSVIAVVLWNSFWGVVVYVLGQAAMELFDIKAMLGFLVIWLVVDTYAGYRQAPDI